MGHIGDGTRFPETVQLVDDGFVLGDNSVECNTRLQEVSDDFRLLLPVLVRYHTIGSLWQCHGRPQSFLFNLPRLYKGG